MNNNLEELSVIEAPGWRKMEPYGYPGYIDYVDLRLEEVLQH